MTAISIPDVHAFNREIPAGKVLLADRLPADARHRKVEVLETKDGRFGRHWRLEARHAGWACAGSTMRWDNGHFAVSCEIDGADHGRTFLNYERAKEAFDKVEAAEPEDEKPAIDHVKRAFDHFVETLMQFGKINRTDAEAVFAYYRKARLVKKPRGLLDDWSVKHGGYFDKATIRAALKATK